MDGLQKVGRIAFRVEGDFWNVYFAQSDTMEDSLLLGTIRMSIVEEFPARKQQLMDLMRAVVSDMIGSIVKQAPVVWKEPVPAPEHERSKSE